MLMLIVLFSYGLLVTRHVLIVALVLFGTLLMKLRNLHFRMVLFLYLLIKVLDLLVDDILEGLKIGLVSLALGAEKHIENSIVYNF